MFTGDFIFNGAIGRMDLPTGNENKMKNSLETISNFPNETIIYPGHGPITTLGREKNNFQYYF